MKKVLLKKMAKAASVALVAGAMVCGAGLTTNNSANAQGIDGLSMSQNTRLMHMGNKAIDYVTNAANKNGAGNSSKTSQKRAARAAHRAYMHLLSNKSNKKSAHRYTDIHQKVVRKAITKRAAALRAAKLAKRAARRSLRRRAVKPTNKKAYRVVKNFRNSRYYHEVWSSAERINKRAVRLDQKRLNKTYAANNSTHLTKYEHRALSRSIKAQQHHINYMNNYVRYDAHMLSLAK